MYGGSSFVVQVRSGVGGKRKRGRRGREEGGAGVDRGTGCCGGTVVEHYATMKLLYQNANVPTCKNSCKYKQ